MSSHELESLTGIGPATAQALIGAGFVDPESIAAATVEQLVGVRGFAEARASALIAEAQKAAQHVESTDADVMMVTTGEDQHPERDRRPKSQRKLRKKLRDRHADLKRRAKKARGKSKTASSKKKRKRWAAEADRLAKRAKKVKKRLARLG